VAQQWYSPLDQLTARFQRPSHFAENKHQPKIENVGYVGAAVVAEGKAHLGTCVSLDMLIITCIGPQLALAADMLQNGFKPYTDAISVNALAGCHGIHFTCNSYLSIYCFIFIFP